MCGWFVGAPHTSNDASLAATGLHDLTFAPCPCTTAGVNDVAKRRLLTVAAAHIHGAGPAVEQQRLSECGDACFVQASAARVDPTRASAVTQPHPGRCRWLMRLSATHAHAGVLVPPVAEQRPHQLQEHNDSRTDPHYW